MLQKYYNYITTFFIPLITVSSSSAYIFFISISCFVFILYIKLVHVSAKISEARTSESLFIISPFFIPSLIISSIVLIYSNTYFLQVLFLSSFPHIWLNTIVIRFSYFFITFICIKIIARILSRELGSLDVFI